MDVPDMPFHKETWFMPPLIILKISSSAGVISSKGVVLNLYQPAVKSLGGGFKNWAAGPSPTPSAPWHHQHFLSYIAFPFSLLPWAATAWVEIIRLNALIIGASFS